MALKRRKNSPYWLYSFTFAGKRYRESTGERIKSAAAAIEAAALNALIQGQPPPRSTKKPTVREFSVRFLQWAENDRKAESTKRFYTYGVRLLLFTELADVPLDRVSTEMIDCAKFVRPRFDRKAKVATDELIPCSAVYTNQALRTLKVMMGKAVEWSVLTVRPRIRAVAVTGRDRLIDHDTEINLQAQYERPTKHGRHNRMRQQAWLVMVILQDTGMRPDEVYPMRIENIHWDSNRVWIPHGKTARATRFVGMSQRLKTMLKAWCGNRRDGWVFPSKRSKSGHLESIAKGFQAARLRGGMDAKLVPYCARHTYGTFQMQATGNVFAVSRAMGHADIKSMEPYQHPDTGELNSAIDERNRAREERRGVLGADWHTNWHTAQVVQ